MLYVDALLSQMLHFAILCDKNIILAAKFDCCRRMQQGILLYFVVFSHLSRILANLLISFQLVIYIVISCRISFYLILSYFDVSCCILFHFVIVVIFCCILSSVLFCHSCCILLTPLRRPFTLNGINSGVGYLLCAVFGAFVWKIIEKMMKKFSFFIQTIL